MKTKQPQLKTTTFCLTRAELDALDRIKKHLGSRSRSDTLRRIIKWADEQKPKTTPPALNMA